MAKQKKVQSRRVPRAAEPRMFGDGKPSVSTEVTPATARGVATPDARGARTAGVTPRSPATGTVARQGAGTTVDYRYVTSDLRRLGIMAAAILSALVVLGFIIG